MIQQHFENNKFVNSEQHANISLLFKSQTSIPGHTFVERRLFVR